MSEKRQDITSGLLLPAGQAVITGILFSCVVAAAWNTYQGFTGWRLFFLALAVGCFISWLVVWRKWQAWGDAERGITPPVADVVYPAESVRVELQLSDDPYRAVDWLDLPISHQALVDTCRELLARGYETSNLGGAGKALTRAQAERLRDYLIGHDLAEWVRPDSHVVGWRLAGPGRALVRRVVQLTHETSLSRDLAGIVPAMQTHTDTQTTEGRWKT